MLVKDVMTHKVITVKPGTRIDEIVQLFLGHHISGVPVLDDAGAVDYFDHAIGIDIDNPRRLLRCNIGVDVASVVGCRGRRRGYRRVSGDVMLLQWRHKLT